jgi:radical SAM superfamily enzyme YgiQ (UPF0313 family)
VSGLNKIKVYAIELLHGFDPVLNANGSALALGCLMSYAKVYREGALKQSFEFQPIVNRYQDQWNDYLSAADDPAPAVWLISNYAWNYRDNLEMVKQIKVRSPRSLIIAGGPHTPAYQAENEAFLHEHPYVDITARGEGEITFAEILQAVASSADDFLQADFSQIHGISFIRDGEVIRTPDRDRNRNLDLFPSPYLTGEFDHPSFDDLHLLALETNRGCPFGCTFCDWGAATKQKFSLFDLDRVKQEIDLISQKRPHTIYITDSNFGAFERDVEIARAVVEAKRKYGYPKEFSSSFAKNASTRLAEIIKIFSKERLMSVGLISIQSTDKDTLDAINRSNIRNSKYEQLIDIFKREKLRLSSELLIGLPGQTVESHKQDLQFFIDRKLVTIAYNTAVMPNAPMNEPGYREKYQIVTDNEGGYITSTSTFTREDLQTMITLYLSFQFFYVIGVLKYYLYYLQMEHGIKMMDFIEKLVQVPLQQKQRYPLSYRVITELLAMRREWAPSLEWTSPEGEFLFNHLDDYYAEIVQFTRDQYDIELLPSVQNTLITAQKAVMPVYGKVIPFSIEVEHDIAAYFAQVKRYRVLGEAHPDFRPLADFPPGTLKVSGLKAKTIHSVALDSFDRHAGSGWELKSPLRF